MWRLLLILALIGVVRLGLVPKVGPPAAQVDGPGDRGAIQL